MTANHRRKRIAIICNNLSGGGSLACLTLGLALRDAYDVQVVGSKFGPRLWPGLENTDLPLTVIQGNSLPGYLKQMRQLSQSIQADAVIAYQLRFTSFGTALLHRARTGTPVALYIDDDDIALTMPGRANKLRNRLREPNGDILTRLTFKLRNRASATFCGSEYFARKFSGICVPLGRDSRAYVPDRDDRDIIRRELGFAATDTVVGFLGNPRQHVGFEDLVAGLERLADDRCILLLVPHGELNEFASKVLQSASIRTKVVEHQPSTAIPGFLAATDVVIVPQRRSEVSYGQLPARIVEAMAMAKPVITTDIGDVQQMLADAAIFVEDRAPEQIADGIRKILSDPAQARSMGQRARQVFMNQLTLEAMMARLSPVLDQLMAPTD